MLKKLLLLTLITQSVLIHCMEITHQTITPTPPIGPLFTRFTSSLFELFSYACSASKNNSQKSLTSINDIRHDAYQLKASCALILQSYLRECTTTNEETLYYTTIINNDKTKFLSYCYNTKDFNIITNKATQTSCKDILLEGYSALGALLIRDDIETIKTIDFFKQLTEQGFRLTEKDKKLIQLNTYTAIRKNKENIFFLLIQDSSPHNPLPYEVNKIIMRYLIELHSKYYRDAL